MAAFFQELDDPENKEGIGEPSRIIGTFEGLSDMERTGILVGVLSLFGATSAAQEVPGETRVDFYDRIQPLLAVHCGRCHGADVQKGGLRLDLKASAFKGGQSGDPAIVPGRSADSHLVRRVSTRDREERMPAKSEPLTPAQVALLSRWIDQGATWPDRDSYWAFRRPVRPAGAVGGIDSTIEARLGGVRPAAPADRVTLLRRAYADLLGVPPSPEEADVFLNDPSPEAYPKLVDRLLADPRYGERWARHWLDLVRYAESDGFEVDKPRPHAWRYRDYVIRSFNDDKPYDRFVMEQIAGDELWPDDPDALVATGFARLGPWDDTEKNDKQRWQDFLNDVADTTGSVFLGLTVGCARCHDHKYDRITQADYYGIQAFFAGVRREAKTLAKNCDPEEVRRTYEAAQAPLKSVRRELEDLRERHRVEALVAKLQQGAPDEVAVTDEDIKKSIDKAHPDLRKKLEAEIKRLETAADLYRPAADAVTGTGKTPKTHLLKRGELGHPGPEVKPSFVAAMVPEGALPAEGRRGALARWLASPENPLSARVIVNRLWQHHFGRGLVATPSDFGRNGERPSHPELLDWLACELVAGGWRLKPMHRLMMTSDAYRRGSTFDPADPENRRFARMNRRRLEGESIRDSILTVSGLLNPKRGGPGVYPKVNPEVLLETRKTDERPARWGDSPESEGFRRTIYVFQRRALMLPFVEAFDGAAMNTPCPQRAVTTVAPQALMLMNGEFGRSAARAFADRVIREAGTDCGDRVARAFRLAFVRAPRPEEARQALDFLDGQTRRYGGAADAERAAFVELCHVLLNANEFLYID